LDQIDQVAADCYRRGDYRMVTANRKGIAPGAKQKEMMDGMDFLERQKTQNSALWLMELSLQQRAHAKEEDAKKRAADIGAQSLKAFKQLLATKYGSILAAWRRALDVSGDGKLSFMEFTNACRAIGYAGSVSKLWKQLDDDDSGVITLYELDPPADRAMKAFDKMIMDIFGDYYTAWTKWYEPEKTGQLELYKFVKKTNQLGYKSGKYKAEDLIQALVPSERSAYLMLRDLSKEAYDKLLEEYNVRAEAEEKRRLEARKDIGARTLAGFKQALIHRFGNLARAWRDGLDVSGDGKLSYTEFTQACRNIGYVGSIKALFKEMDPGSGVIRHDHFDIESYVLMTSFHDLLRKKFGNTLQGWKHGLDLDKNGRLDYDEFLERCMALGYEGDAAILYDCLLREKGSKYLTLYDVDKKAFEALEHGDEDMIADQKVDATKLSFLERQETHRSHQIRVMVGKDVRENIEQFWVEREKNDMCGVGVAGFRHLLEVRYGGAVGGWTMGVDRIGTGKLSWMMFCKGCRGIGFIGNFRQVWNELDDDGSGTVSLMELDPPAATALLEFRDMMVHKFGVVVEGWDDLANGLGHVNKEDFVKKIKKYGFKQDPAKLFEWLKIERCNHVLLQPDIGIVNRIFPQVKPLPWSPTGGPHCDQAEEAAEAADKPAEAPAAAEAADNSAAVEEASALTSEAFAKPIEATVAEEKPTEAPGGDEK
jgi:Ca2+-binding EF-hand superfamily protein